MARVAARDPDALLARHAADDGEEVHHQAEQPGPAVVDAERPADEPGDERLQRALDPGCRHLLARELVLERRVAEAAREDAAVGRLLPVVEAVAAVVRAVEEPLERLGGDHLAAGRDDQALELPEEPAEVAVRRDQHLLRIELLQRLHAIVLADLRAGLGGQQPRAAAPSARAGAPRRRDGRSPRGSGRRAAPRPSRRRSRRHAAPRTRRRARHARRRRRRGGGCPSAGTHRRPGRPACRAPPPSAASSARPARGRSSRS